MADSTFSGLTELAYADVAPTTDLMGIDDVTAGVTKKVTPDSVVLKTMVQYPITNSIAGNVSLNNTSNYFTGPTIAQGSSGTWFASGTVTIADTAGAATFNVKLWDGTTVIASTAVNIANTNVPMTVSLHGYLASPAGNIRISVKDITSTSGLILANNTGESKDSTVSAIRVG